MANTKITSRVIADNAVGVAELNLSDGTSGQALVTDGSGTISFADVGIDGIVSSANATAITIDSSENVGIGTTSPGQGSSSLTTLTVDGAILTTNTDTSSIVYVYEQRFNGSNNLTLGYTANGSTHTAAQIAAQNNLPLIFTAGASEKMKIDSDGDVTMSGTGSLKIPVGTTAQRSSSPVAGMVRYNTTLTYVEYYNGNEWRSTREINMAASGGTETTATISGVLYKIHTFTSSATLTVTSGGEIEFLIISGGGGGGCGTAGGGGAGGYRTNVSGQSSGGGSSAEGSLTLGVGSHTITIGAGGAGAITNSTDATNGGVSSIGSGSTQASGGGAGGEGNPNNTRRAGQPGGSGGGAWEYSGDSGGAGSGTSGQGYAGGSSALTGGAGGGGAGGTAGSHPANTQNSDGGPGVSSNINGTATSRAGGGGGGLGSGQSSASNGGGAGANGSATGTAGTSNTGGGGGGGWAYASGNGGNGGSGLVIIRYPI